MIILEIYVDDIISVMTVFDHIKVYRSTSQYSGYSEITAAATRVPLDLATSVYSYADPNGNVTHWYRCSYYNASTGVESSWSDPVRGGAIKIYHNISYPAEVSLSPTEEAIVDKIRIHIGDRKKLLHNYIASCKSRLSEDKKTVELEHRGYPVYVSLNGVEKTSKTDPYVDGYRYLTFSGSLEDEDVLDLYYYTFRNSDIEIYNAYSLAMVPPGLTLANVTTDHMILQTAIDLLEAESWNLYNEEGAIVKDEGVMFNPTPGLSAREAALKRLRKKLDDLITQYLFLNSVGVRVD